MVGNELDEGMQVLGEIKIVIKWFNDIRIAAMSFISHAVMAGEIDGSHAGHE